MIVAWDLHGCYFIGYDSDEEYDEDDVRYTRRNRGKKYSQIPKDDATEQFTSHSHNKSGGNGMSNARVDSVSMYGDTNSYAFTQDSHSERRNSESITSSEDMGSETEISGRPGHNRREGGTI